MKKHFIITTDKETASTIEAQCNGIIHAHRSFELGGVKHEERYSLVKIVAKTDAGITPEDIFFLGYFAGIKK
ncbi:hypothetical protein KDU71_02465 [Carboxylicivirga sediminis]|uniref:Uncharacterized protein n=1 Tax=Carboxylicivirga sediminis TaxID=2006564 RepID=A0A941EZJ9_9BACT|nr:hypothetical protein [Carboxylicivirga sediminis]MBR8534408.1 hypothetical protein [Carboxylicivirga sediminis]